MPDPASGDFVGPGRFGFNNQAATRRELVNGGDLLKDRSVPPKKLSRDAFPPDIRPGPTDGAPAWHDEPDKTAHEKGVPQSVDNPSRFDRVARADHNHDFTYPSLGMTQTKGAAPADYVAPYFDAGEGPHPAATPRIIQPRKGIQQCCCMHRRLLPREKQLPCSHPLRRFHSNSSEKTTLQFSWAGGLQSQELSKRSPIAGFQAM